MVLEQSRSPTWDHAPRSAEDDHEIRVENPRHFGRVMTYNLDSVIREAIDSVLEQTGDFYLERLIGEDRSTDGTHAIVVKPISCTTIAGSSRVG